MIDDRYARLRTIEWWDRDRMAGAHAIVAGAGALGNEVVKNLVLLGWGRVTVVDRDRVELSNLSRSVLFRATDVGRPKGEVIAERAADINPDCRVEALDGDLRAVVSAGMVTRADLVFGCLDNVVGRIGLGQLASRAGRILIDGGLATLEGTVQVFAPDPGGPCYVCGLTAEDIRELTLRRSCLAYQRRADEHGGIATTPTLTSIVGALMAQQGVKLLHRGTADLAVSLGRELRIDTAHDRFWSTELPRNPDCVLHPEPPPVVEKMRLSWNESWATIADRIRQSLSVDAVRLDLPIRVRLGWRCPRCGRRDDSIGPVLDGERTVCPACLETAAPSTVRQVDGQEPWANTSPRSTGMPPWTWLEAHTSDRHVTYELDIT